MARDPKLRDAQRITQWLKDNPTTETGERTNQSHAKKALNIEGKFKMKGGNLSNNRENLRYEDDRSSAIADRNRAIAQQQTTPDSVERRKANIKASYINQQGGVADHRLTNSMLARGEREVLETRGPTGVQEMRERYQSVGGYGHTRENIQKLTGTENQAKEAQETKLRQYYKHLDKKPDVTDTVALEKWEAKRVKIAQGIDQNLIQRERIAPGGGLDKFAYSTPLPALLSQFSPEQQRQLRNAPDLEAQEKLVREFKANPNRQARLTAGRLVRNAAPLALSIPAGMAVAGESAMAAVENPTQDNVVNAGFDIGNSLADLVGLVPTPLTVGASEALQRALMLGQMSYNSARTLQRLTEMKNK